MEKEWFLSQGRWGQKGKGCWTGFEEPERAGHSSLCSTWPSSKRPLLSQLPLPRPPRCSVRAQRKSPSAEPSSGLLTPEPATSILTQGNAQHREGQHRKTLTRLRDTYDASERRCPVAGCTEETRPRPKRAAPARAPSPPGLLVLWSRARPAGPLCLGGRGARHPRVTAPRRPAPPARRRRGPAYAPARRAA